MPKLAQALIVATLAAFVLAMLPAESMACSVCFTNAKSEATRIAYYFTFALLTLTALGLAAGMFGVVHYYHRAAKAQQSGRDDTDGPPGQPA